MSPVELLQRFVHGRLASEPYFSDVGLYLMRPRRAADGSEISLPLIVEKLEAVLSGRKLIAGKAGVAVTVEMPFVTVPKADAQTLFDVNVVVRCQEVPMINMGERGTRKSAEELGLEVIRALNGFVPHGVSSQLYCPRDAMAWNEDFLPRVTYDVTVSTKIEIDEPRRAMMPRLSVTGTAPGATLEITCATVGAEIYYTLDESFPSPANENAVLYTGPVTIEQPADVFAAAYKNGLSGSHVQFTQVVGGDLIAMGTQPSTQRLVYGPDVLIG